MKYFFLVGSDTVDGTSSSAIMHGFDSACRTRGCDCSIFRTGFLGEEEEIVHYLAGKCADRPLRFIVYGTLANLHFAANGAVGLPGIEVGYHPRSGKNPFLDDFSPGTKIVNALPEKSVDIDLIKINERYCIDAAVLGVDSRIESFRERLLAWKKFLSRFRIPESVFFHLNRIVSPLLHAPAKRVRLCVNGHETIEENILYALFANSGKPTEGYPPISRARVDDGLIDLLFARKTYPRTLPNFGWDDLYNNRPSENEGTKNDIKYRRCMTVEVELAEPCVIAMDGTRYLYDSRFHIAIRPAALKMLIPDPRSQCCDRQGRPVS